MIVLRPHQIAAADAVEAAWRSGIERPLVDACVAAGKSLMFAELARREHERGGCTLICAHTRELVEQNAKACRDLMPHVDVGINAAALGERAWRGPVISASINSIYKTPQYLGLITQILGDEAHLWPHSEAGMYRQLARGLPGARIAGASGTVFRLQGGSLVEGDGAPFDAVVFRYSILDGIRDGYLCPAFSIGGTEDKIDASKLRTKAGEFTTESSDAQMIVAMDNHIMQMVHHGGDRRSWLIFEASQKAAIAMAARMNEWRIPTGLVIDKTGDAERVRLIEAFRAGQLRAMVNVRALTTGFDVQAVDLIVDRAPTKSLGLAIQKWGRGFRTIGGNIEASIAAGKADCAFLDFAGNIDRHGPIDFLRIKPTKSSLILCEECGKRNPPGAVKCWACGEPLLKNCPACLKAVQRGVLDCPHCDFDMRQDRQDAGPPKLSETPSGAELIRSLRPAAEREGGWLGVEKVWNVGIQLMGAPIRPIPPSLEKYASSARWARIGENDKIDALLIPNGMSRTSVICVQENGMSLIVPMPQAISAVLNEVRTEIGDDARRLLTTMDAEIVKTDLAIARQADREQREADALAKWALRDDAKRQREIARAEHDRRLAEIEASRVRIEWPL